MCNDYRQRIIASGWRRGWSKEDGHFINKMNIDIAITITQLNRPSQLGEGMHLINKFVFLVILLSCIDVTMNLLMYMSVGLLTA